MAKQTNKMSKKGNKHEKAKTLVTGLLVTMAERERASLVTQIFVEI
jgi:hypothetical protein